MAADAIAILRTEIAGLAKQLESRRRALAILVGTAPKTKTMPTTRPAGAPAAHRPGQPPAKPLAARIQEYLAAHRTQKFTPAQLSVALQKIDKTVSRGNVQRRLSDLAKARKVRRENGHYSLPSA